MSKYLKKLKRNILKGQITFEECANQKRKLKMQIETEKGKG